jgi:hypothetical protein
MNVCNEDTNESTDRCMTSICLAMERIIAIGF